MEKLPNFVRMLLTTAFRLLTAVQLFAQMCQSEELLQTRLKFGSRRQCKDQRNSVGTVSSTNGTFIECTKRQDHHHHFYRLPDTGNCGQWRNCAR
ncbi:hypothetical protein CS542_10590 [Pedobacter sp. IW39]|nr:hypothetical protein CS542_10590 [Pedobacter sp. IW39]